MDEAQMEKAKAELAEKLGLNKPESLKSTFFQGDFGFSIDFKILIPAVLLFLIAAFLIFQRKTKGKMKKR